MGMLLECSLLVFALGLLCMGLGGRQSMMNKNSCQMTYTSYEKAYVEVSSSVPGVGELYRHPAKGKLNPQPVLFIHGHMGNSDQVRSLSSPMHNDDNYFQYFAVDFKDKSGSAIHGASLLTQAAFVNDAIRTILELYNSGTASESTSSKEAKRPVKVMLVGHSIGGMVARTAVLLSNHPHTNARAYNESLPLTSSCAISDIIMLSTPNKAPPYSLDGSIHAVFQAVNRGWLLSHYNTSNECQQAQDNMLDDLDPHSLNNEITQNATEDNVCLSNNNTRRNEKVELEALCSVCAPQIRLLSITGGDIDIHVPAHLTSLDMLTPRAKNITGDANMKTSMTGKRLDTHEGIISSLMRGLGLKWTLGMLKSVVDMANPLRIFVYLRDSASSFIQTVKSLTSGYPVERAIDIATDSVVDTAVLEGEVVIESGTVKVVSDSGKDGASNDPEAEFADPFPEVVSKGEPVVAIPLADYSNYTYGHLMHFNQESWDTHIYPYVDSQHYSVRSQQLKGCGFVIDHLAIVWCRQLVHTISDAMRILSRNPSNLDDPRIAAASISAETDKRVLPYTDKAGRIRWEEVLAGRKNSTSRKFYSRALSEAPLMIPNVASFHLKNASYHAFGTIAPVEELKYMSGKLGGVVQAFTVWYVSNHLGGIAAAYIFISIMVLCVPLRRRITNWGTNGGSATQDVSDFSSLRMMAHTHLEDIIPIMYMIAFPVLGLILPPVIVNSQAFKELGKVGASDSDNLPRRQGWGRRIERNVSVLLVLMVIVAKLVYVDYYVRGTRTVSKVLFDHRDLLAVLLSYSAAVVLRFTLCLVIYGVRYIIGATWHLFTVFFYKLLTTKSLRKWLKPVWRKLTPNRGRFLPSAGVCSMCVLVFFTYTNVMQQGVVGKGEYAVSVLTLGTVVTSVLALLWTLLVPQEGSVLFDHLQTSLALLHLPMILLAAPSTIYSVRLLFEHPDMFANIHHAFEIFGAERMNFLVAALGISLHWTVLFSWSTHYADTGNITVVAWLISALGRPLAQYSNRDGAYIGTGGSSGSRSWGPVVESTSDCCHEDGGRHARFEEITEEEAEKDTPLPLVASGLTAKSAVVTPTSPSSEVKSNSAPVIEVSDGVHIGCTYRVVHCACYRDTKEVSEWCEFCKCPRCGAGPLAKHMPMDENAGYGYGGTPQSVKTQYPYSANQVLLVGLLAIGVRGFANHYSAPHQQFIYMGGVAWMFLVRDYLVYWRVLTP